MKTTLNIIHDIHGKKIETMSIDIFEVKQLNDETLITVWKEAN